MTFGRTLWVKAAYASALQLLASRQDVRGLDIEYLNRRTWLTDVGLLARTIGVVITGRGAY